MKILEEIGEFLQRGDQLTVADLTRQAVDSGIPAADILNPWAARRNGRGRRALQVRTNIFLPEVLLAARREP